MMVWLLLMTKEDDFYFFYSVHHMLYFLNLKVTGQRGYFMTRNELIRGRDGKSSNQWKMLEGRGLCTERVLHAVDYWGWNSSLRVLPKLVSNTV